MSSVADIFSDLNALILSIDELLQNPIAKEVPNFARDLGAEQQLNTALDVFIGGLNKIADAVMQLRSPLIQADAAVAGLEMIADFGNSSTSALTEILDFLEVSSVPFQPLLTGIRKGGQYLEAGLGLADNLPTPDDLSNTKQRLTKLGSSLASLKATPALPKSSQSPSLSQTKIGGTPS
jgi:hypothetical protein